MTKKCYNDMFTVLGKDRTKCKQINLNERLVGDNRLGLRNHIGTMLMDFLESESLNNLNTFSEHLDNRK